MNRLLALQSLFLFAFCFNASGQNSPFTVNSTNGQSTTNLTSTVGWGGLLKFERYGSAGNFYSLETGAGGNDDLRLYVNGGWSSPIMSFKTNGHVGIGTASPQAHFDISNTALPFLASVATTIAGAP